MPGEKVIIGGAHLIEGWKRNEDGSWSTALAAEPRQMLLDGQPWSRFSFDKATSQIILKWGGDPRLRVFETVLREHGIVLTGRKETTIQGITVKNTLKAGIANPWRRANNWFVVVTWSVRG